jgi:hypothetical protein
MSNRNFGGFITTGIVSANTTAASGVWTLSQYMFQKANGLWPESQGYFLFSGNPTSVNEGANTTFFANTSNIPNNTTVYWTIQNLTTSANDFVETSNSFVISNNTGSFVVRTVNDLTSEGSENFQIAIRQDSITGPILATSPAITLSDTSLSPPPGINFLLVGAGGNAFDPSSNYPGGAGGGGAFEATGFTGYVTGNTYTVQIAAAGGSSTVLSGTFDLLGSINMSATGAGACSYKLTNGSTIAAASGGGGGVFPFNSGGRWFMDSSKQSAGTHSQQGIQSTYSSQYPGVFKNYGGAGVAGQFYADLGATTLSNWAWAHGGGGGASGIPATRTVSLSSIIAYVDGGPGMSSNISGTLSYYGGGGGGYGFFAGPGSRQEYGLGGLGGGANTADLFATQNNGLAGTGGGGAGRGLGGSGIAYFRFPDSQLSANTTGGASSYLSGTDRVVAFFSSGTITFSRK